MKKKGDLYWNQLSMWDFSDICNVDAFKKGGFHFELMIVTEVTSSDSYRFARVKKDDISGSFLDELTPKENQCWTNVMGNDVELAESYELNQPTEEVLSD